MKHLRCICCTFKKFNLLNQVNGLIIDAPNDETPSPVSTSGSNSPQPKGDSNSSNAGVVGKVLNEKSQMLAGRMDPIPNMVGEEDGFVMESDEGEATEAPTDTGDGGDDADGGGDTPEPAEPPPPPPSPPPAPSPSSTGPVTGEKHLFNLVPQADAASTVYQLDIVIENLWSVFSHAWARCYPEAPSRQLWGPRFKQLFFRDILEPLEERWKDPGPLSYYLDLIMGDYDVQLIQHNALYCVDAGYFTTGAGIFELVRPVKLTDISEGANAFQNHQIN
ncbi:unnamed protein product [Orchesella dallaii]|uniref:Uncharacterized protein n=1 Tax=Orchesella dallaii TaxID=48710 RepID=A0ABP1Q6H7_9HEXA